MNLDFVISSVSESNLGQPKAKCVCAFLQELNDAVKAKFIEEHPVTLIDTNPSFFSQFTVVIATQVNHLLHIFLDSLSIFLTVNLKNSACRSFHGETGSNLSRC